jgi:hypothetical protein
VAVDPDLALLLEQTAERAVDAVERLRDTIDDVRREIGDLRRTVDEDRARDDGRFREIRRDLGAIDRKAGALVVEREHPDGTTEIHARRAGLGRLGTFLAVIGACTPIVVGVLEVVK